MSVKQITVEEAAEESASNIVESLVDLSNMPRPATELQHIQAMDADIEARTLYIFDEITENFGAWFTTALKYLEKRSHDPITIWLSTPGGNVESMFVFHDLVQSSPCKITVIATGQVCSAGVLMLACGHERLVTESCILMAHRFQNEVQGTQEQMECFMKVLKWQEDHWAELMAKYTPAYVDGRSRDAKYWGQLCKKNAEWWVMGGDAIVHEGIADGVYRKEKLESS